MTARLRTEPEGSLGRLSLPAAPPVTRGVAAAVVRPRVPAFALIVLGLALIITPIAGGLIARVAGGRQLVDRFAPYLTTEALGRYDADLSVLRGAARGVDEVYIRQRIPTGRFPGLDTYRQRSDAVDRHASTLLADVRAAQPDYRTVARVGGLDRIPFLLLAGGGVALYAGIVLRYGARRRARGSLLLVLAMSTGLVAYPLLSGFDDGAGAGAQMITRLEPVMSAAQVRTLQQDFIVLVSAVGELDTTFRTVPAPGPAATQLHSMVVRWPAVSADLASLVGTINDNLEDFQDLRSLDSLTRGVGVSGLQVFPWVLVGVGAATATLAAAALPRRRKDTP